MTEENTNRNKYKKLALSFLFDAIGMVSFIIPFIGEFSDIVWAPMAGLIMIKMYKGATGKIAGLVAVFEELIPGLDFVPTFTLTWIYEFVIKGNKASEKIIEIKS
ncbi:MAG: hypothetical protein HRT68_13065 [Flavobacteriaceae bacterium]|nr:hypothetical protein [Flavobacteriaceae bacterium]